VSLQDAKCRPPVLAWAFMRSLATCLAARNREPVCQQPSGHPAMRRGLAPPWTTLWRNFSRQSWFLARRLRGAGLELQWAGSGKTIRARRGEPAARIAGPPGELLLYLFGRQDAAHVEVTGPPAMVEAVRHARFGM
jgi:hypothetical protein